MRVLGPGSQHPGSLLIDPMQIIAMLTGMSQDSQAQKQVTGNDVRGRAPAFNQQAGPLNWQNYMARPDAFPQVAQTLERMPAASGPSQYNGPYIGNAPIKGLHGSYEHATENPGHANLSMPGQPMNPVAPHNFNINVQDQRPGGGPTVPSVAEAMIAANPQLAAAAAMQPQPGLPQATEAGPLQTGGQDTSVPPIAALDPSFGQPVSETIAPPQAQGMPQMPLSPPPNLPDIPPVPHNFIAGGPLSSGPTISAPAPAPAGPGGPVSMLRFPIGQTPAISQMPPWQVPPVAMGGPTRAETIPPAALVRPHLQIGAGYRRPAPAQPSMPTTPPIDNALTGMEANRRFIAGPGPGATLEYPAPSLPAAPAPAAPATVAPSPPNTMPQTGAAMPPDFEDNLIKTALMLSARRKAMTAGAHG